jgi:hypothetical protein
VLCLARVLHKGSTIRTCDNDEHSQGLELVSTPLGGKSHRLVAAGYPLRIAR